MINTATENEDDMRYKRWSELRLRLTNLGPGATGYWSLQNKRIYVAKQISILEKGYVVLHELGHAIIDVIYGMNKFGLCSIQNGKQKLVIHAYYDYFLVLYVH